MLVYRIANARYKDSTLTGIGAEKLGGRWNEPGTRAVYCSENVSLALLEYYVHSDSFSLLPKEILVARIEIPDEFEFMELDQLPGDWNHYPYSSGTSAIFTRLAKNRDFFALKVPSAIVPLESNVILNPLYKDFGKVEVVDYVDLRVDRRLKNEKK